MNKVLLILFLFCTFLSKIISQEFRAGYQLGYGYYYGLKELRELQEELLKYDPLNLDPEIVANYPPWFTHSVFAEVHVGSGYHIGLTGTFFSTGAKNSYADYSGTFGLESVTNGYMFGVTQKYGIIEKQGKQKIFYAYAQLIIGGIYSELKMYQYIILNNTEESENMQWKSMGAYIEPGFGTKARILNWLELDLLLSFIINPDSKINSMEYPHDPLETYDGMIHMNWSGIQISLGINVILNTKKSEDF